MIPKDQSAQNMNKCFLKLDIYDIRRKTKKEHPGEKKLNKKSEHWALFFFEKIIFFPDTK